MTTTEYSAVQEAAIEFAEACHDAEAMLTEIVHAGRRANYAELTWFQKHLRWDEAEVRRQVSRMTTVLRLRAIAGTPADREAAAKEAAAAADVLAKEAPKLEAKIAELSGKLASMERDERLATKRVDEQADAVEKLRTMVPQHIRDSVRDAVNRLATSTGRQISEMRTRVFQLDCLIDTKRYDNQDRHLEAIQRAFPAAVIQGVSGAFITRQFSPEWPAIKESILAEAADLRAKIEAMQPELDAAIAEAEAPLTHYSN